MTNTNLSFTTYNSYAQALFELSSENNNLSEIEDQVKGILKMISENVEFQDLIKDPTNKIEELENVINLISEHFKFNQLLKKFMVFVISKRRFFYIEKILSDFLLICSNSRGEMHAEISSARDLNENEINKVKSELMETFGLNINLNYKYDPSLIGGLIIKVGSTMIDTSIKNKLQQIENRMIEA